MIDYLVPKFFAHLSPKHNGGMHTKVDRVRRAVSELYEIRVISDLSSMRSEFLLIEPFYFRMSGINTLDGLRSHPALVSERTTKILYCSETEVFRWTGQFRKALLEICDVVTCNCDYQASLFTAVGIQNPYRLIDPIPEDEFQPLTKHKQVVAIGRISEIKGSAFVAELFRLLADTPIETVYVGGAKLWGEANAGDLVLEAEIREYTDIFHENVPPRYVPEAIGAASFFVGSTIYDVFSSCHAEALMSGCISIGGAHPIYAERPGFTVKTAQAAVDMIAQLTNDFKEMPAQQRGQRARHWAEQHLSFDCFKGQLTDLLRAYDG